MAIPLERLEGKYEILDKLREGGMGAIYKVRHRLRDELRVIKIIRPQHEGDESLRARFRKEAETAARLDHPGLARVYDFVVDEDGAAYLVMEYIAGTTLGELLRTGRRLPVELSLEIARQGLEALGYLHDQGVIHRDVSPDNLMLAAHDGRPLIKLIDLGLVKTLDGRTSQLTGTGMFVGKFRYAAPEQFDDRRGDQRRADLYSFAVVLYELLTGKYPIAGSTPSSLIAGHLFKPPLGFALSDPEGRVPAEIRRAVVRGLEKDPADRFEDAAGFAAALEAGGGRRDLSSPEIAAILDLVHRSGLPRLAPVAPAGSTQVRFDRKFLAEPTPAPEATRALRLSEVDAPPPEAAPAPRPEVADLLRQARERHRAGRLEEAIELAERARRRAPQHALIRVLLVELERELASRRDDEARQEARRGAEDEIRRLVEEGDLESAEERLPDALDVAGPTFVLRNLQARVEEELGRSDREGPVDPNEAGSRRALRRALLADARRSAEAEDLEAAQTFLDRVLEDRPGDPEALALRASVEACLEVRAAERRQTEDVERTLVDIQTLLDAGRTPEALAELDRAEDRFGDYGAFESLHREAVQTRVLELQEHGVGPRALVVQENSRPEEKSAVEDGEHAVGDDRVAGSGEEGGEDDHSRVAEITATIKRYQSQGRPGRALEELQRAVRTHGQTEVFQDLRTELGHAMLDRDAEEGDSASFHVVPEETPAGGGSPDPYGPAETAPPAQDHHDPDGPLDLPLDDDGLPPVSRPAGGADLGPRVRLPDRHQRRRRKGGGWKLAVAFLVVLAALFAGALLSRLGGFGEAADEPAPREVESVALPPGTVVLDAVPWAEIVSIRAVGEDSPQAAGTGSGTAPPGEEIDLTPSRFTPVVLELPPGTYRVRLRHPPSGREEAFEIDVESQTRTEVRRSLEELDGTRYFEKLGW